MNVNKQQLEKWAELDCDSVNFDDLESKLTSELEEQMSDLELLEQDREKIGNPNTIGETVMNVVWEQFINQVGVVAGEDFIKENRGLTLDLRDSAHIQTTENFANGKIATHNDKIDYQKRYDDWQNNFARENGDPNGKILTRYDSRSGEDRPVLRSYDSKQPDNYNKNYAARGYIDDGRPKGSASVHKDHTIPAAEIIRDAEANAHLSREEQAAFANSDINLVDLDASANESKRDSSMTEWLDSERNGEKPADRFNIDEKELRERDEKARAEYKKRKKQGEERSIETGKQSQKEEALRIGGKALRSVIMGLLASLIKDIIRKLISWFRAGNRKFSSFIESVKEAILSFVANIKTHLLNAGNTLVTTIATAIFGPVIGMIKKAWIFLKQGYKSVKEAIAFMKNPANKNMPCSVKMMEVGKIVIVGLTAGGAIVLSEVIEKGLMTIPGFGVEIPLIGSLANIIGMFLGALVSGLIGALALNAIDRLISKRLKTENIEEQFDKKNEIMQTQEKLHVVAQAQVIREKASMATHVVQRHLEAGEHFNELKNNVQHNSADSDELHCSTSKTNDEISNILDNL